MSSGPVLLARQEDLRLRDREAFILRPTRKPSSILLRMRQCTALRGAVVTCPASPRGGHLCVRRGRGVGGGPPVFPHSVPQLSQTHSRPACE